MSMFTKKKNRLLRNVLSVMLTIAILFTSSWSGNFVQPAEAAAAYTTIYLTDDTAEHWIGNDNAVIELVDNTSGHDHYIMTRENNTTWSVRVPSDTYNVTFNRLSPDKSIQWNSWSAGGRGSNRNDKSTWHSTYHATVPEHGYWDGEAEYEEGFHEGDVIYLDYYGYTDWGMSNALFYVNFTDASKTDTNGADINISKADVDKFAPVLMQDEIEERVYTYTVTAEDEGAAMLRFWRGNSSTLWNYSVTLSYSDYQAGNNCVKVQGWNNTGYVCPYTPRRHIPVFDTLELNVTGNKKVNRRIDIDFNLQGETEYLKLEDTQINICKTDGDGQVISENEEDYLAYNDSAADWNHRELIFKESGTYKITAVATDGTDNFSDEKIITVAEDKAPVAGIKIVNKDADDETEDTFVRNAEGILNLEISDDSVSEIYDEITTRDYCIFYDANNNGEYEDDEAVNTMTGNEACLSLQLDKVGKYRIRLQIQESYTDTIPELVADDGYLRDEVVKEFEIVNRAPESSVNVKKSKTADIIFTVGNADSDTLKEYAAASEKVKGQLGELGIEANVSTVSTSALTATDTFAWTEYDHCNMQEWVYPPKEKHIYIDGKDIKMMGYYMGGHKDFMYIQDKSASRKIFDFDIQRDGSDWHSMEGGGFLFNTCISEEKDTINGYCVLVTREGLKLVQIDRVSLYNFRNGAYDNVQEAGRLLKTFPIDNLYGSHHIKIIVDRNVVTVYDGDTIVADEYVIPDDGVDEYGYGPITSHLSHDCYQQSYFTFKNIVMQSVVGESLSDVVNNHEWTPGDNHYVINLSSTSVPELSDNCRMSNVSAALISNNVSFYGIGNSTAVNQYNALLDSIDGTGENIELFERNEEGDSDSDNDEITVTSVTDSIVSSIIADINSKDYEIDYTISSDEKVEYTGTYSDPDGDKKGEEVWKYEYNPSVFGTNTDEIQNISLPSPITMFKNTGAYTISHKASDNVANGNESMAGYSLWSDEDNYQKLILSQHRPVANITAEAKQSKDDNNICLVNVRYSSYDEDHMDDRDKGIRKEEFYYKELGDSEWTSGRFPSSVIMGTTYLVKYIVTDVEGTKSRPAVAAIKTNESREYTEPVDNNPPTVNMVVSDTTVEAGSVFYVEAYAEDDYGITQFSVKHGEEEIADSYGRFECSTEEAGEYIITVSATDIGGNTVTDSKTVNVIDSSDVTAPTIEITSPENGNISGETDIIGTIKDDKKLKSYTVTRTKALTAKGSYDGENAAGENDSGSVVIACGTDEIIDDVIATIVTDGLDGEIFKYEITAEDMAGHTTTVTCTVQITEDTGDRIPPHAYITDIVLDSGNGTVSVYGTVSDETSLSGYTLYMKNGDTSGIDEPEQVLISSGNEAVTEGIIGTINTQDIVSGTYILTLAAEDVKGNTCENVAQFTYLKRTAQEAIDVSEDLTAPVITADLSTSITDCGLKLALNGTIDDENLASYSVVTGKVGEDGNIPRGICIASGTECVVDRKFAEYTYQDYGPGDYGVIVTAKDMAGNERIVKYNVVINNKGLIDCGYDGEENTDGDGIDSLINITLSKTSAKAGETVNAYITYPKTATNVSVTADNAIVALNGRTAGITANAPGEVAVTLSVVVNGEVSTVQKVIRFFDRGDNVHPTADFISPEPDSDLNTKTDIYATIKDETGLAYYILDYKEAGGSGGYREISRGTDSVENKKIGELDTTLLMNGSYILRITAVDNGGNRIRAERTVNVTGNLKVGNMSLGFTDINSSVAGIPLTVTRNYDSRNKSSGDFGTGWTLGLQSAAITESNDITQGYKLIQQGDRLSTCYYMEQTVNHDITVTYGDGTSDRFELKVTPERSALIPIYEVEVTFRCVTDKKVKLELDGGNQALVAGGQLIFEAPDMLEKQNYVLTRADGTKLYLSPEYGLLKMEDTNGNTVKITKNGYKHSSGNSVIFTRDGQGRITKAEEKNSAGDVINSITYSYDNDDNLAAVTDTARRTVIFTYDSDHNMVDIIDPSGIAVARNIYDEDGRLTATVDADGNRIEYEHDIDGKTEVVRDKMGNATVYTYDDNGNILKTVDAMGNVTSNTYDKDNNVLTKTDALGNTTTYSYDDNKNLSTLTTPEGVTENIAYNQLNLVSGITLDGSGLGTFGYDSNGNLLTETDALGNETELTYESDGKLTSITDSIGTVQALTYDENDNLVSMTDGDGNVTKYNYNSDGRCTGVTVKRTDADGTQRDYISVYTYDSTGNIQTVTSPDGKVTAYEYDYRNNRTAMTAPDGKRTQYTYDTCSNMTGASYPDGTTENFTYDKNGNCITATDRMGVTVVNTYDKLNRLVKKTYADGAEESYTYDANGNVLTHTSASGGVTVYTYDSMNRNTSITDAYGNTTTFEYNDRSLLTKRTDALGNEYEYWYDANGNQIKLIYPDGNFEETEYDARGRVISRTDRNGNVTEYAYDGADNLISVTDALNGTYTYTYDETYELTAVTDANGNTTSYQYDADGNLIKITNAAGYYAAYTYDSYGYNTGYTDYAGNGKTYTYDSSGRIIRITDSDGSTGFTYDGYGRIISATDSNGMITYTYDSYGRLSQKTTYDYGTVSYTYDVSGNISTVTTTVNGVNAGTTSYGYDLMDRIVRVVGHDGKATLYEYDAVGNRTAVRHEGGLTVSYQYDECQRLINETVTDTDGSVLMYYGYEYGNGGEKTKAVEALRKSKDDADARVICTEYGYDELLRLTGEVIKVNDNVAFGRVDFTDISTITWQGTIENQYTYDAVSNRTSKATAVTGDVCGLDENVLSGTTCYTYNNLNQLVSAEYKGNSSDTDSCPATTAYTYDMNGNLLSEHGGSGDKNYTYNAKNQLVTATLSLGNNVTIESYTYDYEGNRVTKQVNEDSEVYYLNDTYDELTQVSLELSKNADGTYGINKFYTRGLELISADIKDDDSSGNQASYTKKLYIQDGHGSVTALSELDEGAAGQSVNTITDTYVYDAYGNLLKKTGDTDNDYLYTGEQYNESTGLYYLRARYMNPEAGTFISMDTYSGTLDNPVSLHKYLYANANPVMYTDPTGNFSLMETSIAQGIQSTINSVIVPAFNIQKLMSWANLAVTAYDVAGQVRMILAGEANILGLAVALAKGMIVQTLITCAATAVLGEAAVTVLKVIGIVQDTGSFIEAVKSGDPEKIIVESLRLAVSVFTLGCQCFTGDTPVSTEDGDRRIDEIEAGDKVWAYNAETGKKELKEVLNVSVTETDILVHVITSDGEEIETTMFHPFYVKDGESLQSGGKDEKSSGMWVAASNLVAGDALLMEDGRSVYVNKVRIEKLDESIKVYNLEIDKLHTYFVAGGVLVHNGCNKLRKNMERSGNTAPEDGKKYHAHHIFPKKFKAFFSSMGIDVDNEEFGIWVEEHEHLSNANIYNKMWENEVNILRKLSKDKIDAEFLDFLRRLSRLW